MLLEADNVSVEYGGAVALDGVSIRVDEGEVVGLVGSNGAGKTTLLNAVSGVVAHSGAIQFLGEEISGLGPHEVARRGIAHVPEGRRLFPYLTVEENLGLGAYAKGKADAEDFERVYSLFPKLKDLRGQNAGRLSGGEQQMVAIGRALMQRPRLLILDEPSLGLAPILVDAVYEKITELKEEGQTILLAEQNVAECLEVSARTYVIQTGRIVRSASSRELAEAEEIRAAFLGL